MVLLIYFWPSIAKMPMVTNSIFFRLNSLICALNQWPILWLPLSPCTLLWLLLGSNYSMGKLHLLLTAEVCNSEKEGAKHSSVVVQIIGLLWFSFTIQNFSRVLASCWVSAVMSSGYYSSSSSDDFILWMLEFRKFSLSLFIVCRRTVHDSNQLDCKTVASV